MRTILRALVIGGVALTLTAGGTVASASPSGNDGCGVVILSEKGTLSRHQCERPLLPTSAKKITGLAKGDRLIGLDTRPATGALYSLAASGRLYRLEAKTAKATAVGSPTALTGKAIGFDFNPTVDRIRVVTDTGLNLRLHPDTGSIAGTDTPLTYPGRPQAPRVAASGYTNSVAGATSTALYGLDSGQDTLVKQGSLPGETPVVSPNTGQLTAIGKLGLNIGSVNGFDIAGTAKAGAYDPRDYKAVAAVRVHGVPLLVRIDLASGRARVVSPLLTYPVGLALVS
ncbi:DUF4394 domain-containing protein [Amycolatopsis sp. BJA-103]|uniref:DUF4394 domain-containing protein n=1 Tax=Amycolatopsis sp. BJA-103 TaxID=1911175 RepID=UPI000C759E63|nr:DUF4394 domain-containing protein [Amycolatopsis sp. BJA-103]AUI60220.1 hypothetical protein BKN51_19810 [Amycolatopsis sp. BJA-103]PNE13570.1 hypothetical protein B1H26_39600 [Amycolatopsis sp. BJA-103]